MGSRWWRRDYVTGDTDFSAHITKIKAKGPDLIAVGGTWVETANMMKEAQKQDLKVLWVGGVGMGNARIIENTGQASEGAVHNATYDKDATTELNQSYVGALRSPGDATGRRPTLRRHADAGPAIKVANIANSPKTLEADRRVRGPWPIGLSASSADGKITMVDMVNGKHAGDAIKKGTLIQIQNGKFVPGGEGKAAALKLR
jgi:ABC-type branched-subunit amino acid transport system substrate-binding protein